MLQALGTGRLYLQTDTPATHFYYRLSRPQSHSAAGRIIFSGIETATFQVVAQCVNQPRHRERSYRNEESKKSVLCWFVVVVVLVVVVVVVVMVVVVIVVVVVVVVAVVTTFNKSCSLGHEN